MKIAAVTDIHGNMEALKAVIDDIIKEKSDKIFICGDLAVAGPEPADTIDFLLRLRDYNDIVFIRGNTEEWLSSNEFWPKNETMVNAIKYTQQILRPEQIEFLKSLPEQHVEKIGQLSIRLVHEEDTGKKLLGEVPDDIILCGHTHLPLVYKSGNQLLINTGSAGRPFTENPEACYVIINYPDPDKKDFSFYHKFIEYDRKATAEKLMALGFGGCEKLAKVILNPPSRHELFS